MASSNAQLSPAQLPNVPYTLTRLGVIMSGDPSDPYEVEGVLNPATACGTDGELYLYPRLVAAGNISRVGKARVVVVDGVPDSVERQGVVLEPDRPWEHGVRHGGVEDPRITWIPSLNVHVMTYVAFGPFGPRPAVAISHDLESWTRLGPFQFEYDDALEIDLNLYPNKDVLFFPEPVPDPDGRPSYAVIHRPMWEFSFIHTTRSRPSRPVRPILVQAFGSRTFRRRTCERTSRRSRARADTASWPAPSSSGRASRWAEDHRRSKWTRAGS